MSDDYFESLIKPIEIVGTLASIWPSPKDISTFGAQLRIIHRILVIMIIAMFCVALTVDIIKQYDNIEEVTQRALIASCTYLCIIRLLVFSSHQQDLLYIITTIRSDWKTANKTDRQMFIDRCLLLYKLSKYSIGVVGGIIFAYLAMPIIQVIFFGSKERKLPFYGYFCKNQYNSPIYESLYLFSVVMSITVYCVIVGGFSLSLVMVIHGAAKFAIICKKFEALENNQTDADEFFYCVKQHQEAIYFAERVENSINILELGQFVSSLGLLCFSGFQLTTGSQSNADKIKYFVFFGSAVTELFLHSYSGNQLIIESNAVGTSIYESNWVGGSYTKNMPMIMIRSLVPCTVTVGKFYDVSLLSFTSTLNTAFSYLMVLRAKSEE